MKDFRSISFSNGEVYLDEDGVLWITEVSKEETVETNLTELFDSLAGASLSITIKKENK